jgi:hypothetical protein
MTHQEILADFSYLTEENILNQGRDVMGVNLAPPSVPTFPRVFCILVRQ